MVGGGLNILLVFQKAGKSSFLFRTSLEDH